MGVITLHTADAFEFACCSSPLAVKTHRRLYVLCVVCLKQHLQSCRVPARMSCTQWGSCDAWCLAASVCPTAALFCFVLVLVFWLLAAAPHARCSCQAVSLRSPCSSSSSLYVLCIAVCSAPDWSSFSARVQCWRALPVYLLLGLQPEATCQCCSKSIQMLALASLRAALPLCHITTLHCMPCAALAFGMPLLSRRRCLWRQQLETSLLGIWTASARLFHVTLHVYWFLSLQMALSAGWLRIGPFTKKASTARHRGASLIGVV